jgi:hypothetical protein
MLDYDCKVSFHGILLWFVDTIPAVADVELALLGTGRRRTIEILQM